MSDSPKIVVRNLSVVRPRSSVHWRAHKEQRGQNQHYLEDLSFTFSKGDKVLLRGESDRSKTALIRTLAGLVQPTSGSIEVSGGVFPGITPQFGMMPAGTLYQNVFLRGLHLGLPLSSLADYCEEVFDGSKMSDLRQMLLKEIPNDLAIDLWLKSLEVANPVVLLLEGWMSPASIQLKKRSMSLLGRLIQKSDLAIVVTKNVRSVSPHCTHEMVVDDAASLSLNKITSDE